MITHRYPYQEIQRRRVDGKRLYDTESGFLPSVTTILDQTKPQESVDALNSWRDRVGSTEATRITNEAANVGTLMHKFLEFWIKEGNFTPGASLPHVVASRMANTVIQEINTDLEEIWGTEIGLYYPGLYAGTTDLVGVWKGRPTIMDFKQSNKPKKREWISDYFMQGAAYGLAHNSLFDTDIRSVAIFMCTRDCEFQLFEFEGEEFDYWATEWSNRVSKFYDLDK